MNISLRSCMLVLVAAITMTACELSDVIVTLNVDSEQKISESEGNFDGVLADDDRFGSAVAVLGDLEVDGVTDLLVGAPLDDDGGNDRGAVWILFMNDDGTVDLEAKLSDTEGNFRGDLDDGDRFGSALTGIADLNGDGFIDLAAGAPFDDDGGDDRGAVYVVFLLLDGTVLFEQKISDTAGNFLGGLHDGDRFGAAITVLGDLDGDGITDLAVGAPFDDTAGSDTGALWILFMNANGTVRAAPMITMDTAGFDGVLNDGDAFASSLTNLGDLNLDGVVDLAVGAPGDDEGGTDAGAVWILFLTANGTVLSEHKIAASDEAFTSPVAGNDRLGTAVATVGDLDRDGVIDIAAGAPLADDGGTDRGALWFLFMKRDGRMRDSLKISGTEGLFAGPLRDGDRFGAAITPLGNLDRRREVDLAVGAPLDSVDGTGKGAAWVLFMDRADTETECERSSVLRFLGVGDCE
jgi:hypothetical protein